MILHAGLIANFERGLWRGVLIRGPSGSGKSDLALRAGERLRLVADDRVVLFVSQARLFGRAPKPLINLLEVSGLGVILTNSIPFCEIVLVARCGQPERFPDVSTIRLLGVEVPEILIAPLEVSTPAKLCRALEVLGSRH